MAALLQDKHWSWFEEEVNRHYLKFTQKRNINIFVGTWNVNAKEPKDSIKSWLFPDAHGNFDADLYVLGFQEIVDLNAANLWIENTANEGWERLIASTLSANSAHEFVQVATRHLVGILLCVFAKRSLRPCIRNVMTSMVGVGLFGTAGNKGGVGIRMQLLDSDVCFICTHLAAHKNNVQGRNQDYLKILQNMKFEEESQRKVNESEEEPQSSSGNGLTVMGHHDMVFWLGDLNYRLNWDDLEEVFAKVETRDWKVLLLKDQLNLERAKQRAFGGFEEHRIDFAPTYKFQPGTSLYERRPDKKKRFPAWCDRILWRRGSKKTTDISDVACVGYGSSQSQTMSDHKPVFGLMKLAANVFDQEKRAELRRQIMKNKDLRDNEQLPSIETEPEVAFALVKFGESEQQQFRVQNTGHVPVLYRFTHAEHKDSLPKWLKISPQRGLVRPHETETVTFEICVTSEVVKQLTARHSAKKAAQLSKVGSIVLEETVLLRIENSSDNVVPMKFVVVSAKYLLSCFGNRIEHLVRFRKPIRYIEDAAPTSDVGGDDGGDDDGDVGGGFAASESTLSIPKELWRLMDHLYKYGMDTESIFIQRGITTEISEIRECLDTGKAFTRYEMHSVGEALVRLLESLQDPVWPVRLLESYEPSKMDTTAWCRQALMRLPLSHYNTFIYTISFLREVLKHASRNKLTPEKLAYQFSSALMQSSVKDVGSLATFKPFLILRHFLSSDLFL